MSTIKAAADLVARYLTARALFRRTPWEVPSDLEYLIGRGVRLLPDGVLVNEVPLQPAPAIIGDRKDPMFWSAIIGGEDGAIDMDPAEQEQVRQFVLDDEWILPVTPSEIDVIMMAVGAALGRVSTRRRWRSRGSRIDIRAVERQRRVSRVLRQPALQDAWSDHVMRAGRFI
jgi:hypothetical protein